jgi:hypothetical protein
MTTGGVTAVGATGTARAAGGAGFREISAVLLRYQMSAPQPTKAARVTTTSRVLRQDFMESCSGMRLG